MTFEEFKTWFATFDSTLAGKSPSLPQWWELKARLDACGSTASPADVELPSRPAEPSPLPPATPAPQADFGEAEDMPRSEFTVYEEAVQLLKRPRRASRAAP